MPFGKLCSQFIATLCLFSAAAGELYPGDVLPQGRAGDTWAGGGGHGNIFAAATELNSWKGSEGRSGSLEAILLM